MFDSLFCGDSTCVKSSKIVIEARAEASSRRAFIGYIFIHEQSSTETNDFTLILFPSFFFFSSFPIYRFDFRCENASFSALKKINRILKLQSILAQIHPGDEIAIAKGHVRKRKWENSEKSLSSLPCITRANRFFYRFVEMDFFPFQRHPNKKKKIIVRSRWSNMSCKFYRFEQSRPSENVCPL